MFFDERKYESLKTLDLLVSIKQESSRNDFLRESYTHFKLRCRHLFVSYEGSDFLSLCQSVLVPILLIKGVLEA